MMSRSTTPERLPTRSNVSAFEFTGKINKVVFDINPHLTEEDRQAIHEHEQHAALADGIGA